MWTPRISQAVGRAVEAGHLLAWVGRGARAKLTLAECYAAIVRDPLDVTEVALDVDIGGRVFPVTMRRCDLFTLAEIAHEKQYQLETPVEPGGVVVDAGANIGLATLWFRARYPGSRIFAFEPSPGNFRYLQRNAEGVEDVHVEDCAVGRTDGILTLFLGGHNAVHTTTAAAGTGPTVDVKSIALGPYLKAQGVDRISILKLDVEGAEVEALEGLGDLLGRTDVVVGECHEREIDVDAFYQRLASVGLRLVKKQHFKGAEAAGVHAFEVSREGARR